MGREDGATEKPKTNWRDDPALKAVGGEIGVLAHDLGRLSRSRADQQDTVDKKKRELEVEVSELTELDNRIALFNERINKLEKAFVQLGGTAVQARDIRDANRYS